ncbi:hypothetical protein PRZ48_004208 [Zasmidium cellare]|uniref:Uncharacterized protein n=1 Tax=Zasmidium cellare TaxID=395010 RepID=A0ABR0EZK2_ZASCE|nr:hypothetical protein PRZ48_004208 [Zasmidium cellare]
MNEDDDFVLVSKVVEFNQIGNGTGAVTPVWDDDGDTAVFEVVTRSECGGSVGVIGMRGVDDGSWCEETLPWIEDPIVLIGARLKDTLCEALGCVEVPGVVLVSSDDSEVCEAQIDVSSVVA